MYGFLPSSLRDSVIIPIVKDKCKNISDIGNYRPIALSSVLSKVFELILLGKLNSYFCTTDYQFGFRVRQIVCPVIPGTPKSVVGPLDILPGCSVGTLDLALAASVNIIAITALSQTRERVMFKQVQWSFKASRVVSDGAVKP